METYKLLTNSGEQIHITKATNLVEAIKFFAEIKKLDPEDLLNIYKIEEVYD